MYLANEIPVSCPTCGHFVAYSVDKCGTCREDLSDIDLEALARLQWAEGSRRRHAFVWLVGLLGLCWSAVFWVT